jgi:hypothetical protein
VLCDHGLVRFSVVNKLIEGEDDEGTLDDGKGCDKDEQRDEIDPLHVGYD